MKITKGLALVAFLFGSITYADQGRGGGDPAATEFLIAADKICIWMGTQKKHPSISTTTCLNVVEKIQTSLNSFGKAKLIFSNEPLFDESGNPKDALFDRQELSIKIDRNRWISGTIIDKYVTVGIEISGLLGIQDRYQVGTEVRNNWNQVFSATPASYPSLVQFNDPNVQGVQLHIDFVTKLLDGTLVISNPSVTIGRLGSFYLHNWSGETLDRDFLCRLYGFSKSSGSGWHHTRILKHYNMVEIASDFEIEFIRIEDKKEDLEFVIYIAPEHKIIKTMGCR
ncbi:MAG: hypothetical protein AB7F59_01825 [Bdellovibrionales bacterium]